MAVIGRPNAGKSTLINALLGEDRLLTGPEAGLTRDAIGVNWDYGGVPFKLVDTAGMRRKTRVEEGLERMAVGDTLRTMRYAQVVVVVMSAENPLEKQDLTIARLVIEEGRALVIALNKWDLVSKPEAYLKSFYDRLANTLPQVKGIPVIPISAMKGKHLDSLMQSVMKIYEVWNRKVPTAKLNQWLKEATERHPPPLVRGRRLRLKYMTQTKTRPPTFLIFSTVPEKLPDDYLKFLTNDLREAFDLPGVPVRISLRKPDNPYVDE
jgi:GTP-binding protein